MPWRLLAFLFVLLAITFFIGFNLDNRCDVSFIFYKYADVPIFVSLLFAYAAGALTVLPFFLASGKKRRGKDASGGRKSSGKETVQSNRPEKKKRGTGRGDSGSADYGID
jgi:hypothetical protein